MVLHAAIPVDHRVSETPYVENPCRIFEANRVPDATESHSPVSLDGYIVARPIHDRLSVSSHEYGMADTVHLSLTGFDCDVFSHPVNIRFPIAAAERVGVA